MVLRGTVTRDFQPLGNSSPGTLCNLAEYWCMGGASCREDDFSSTFILCYLLSYSILVFEMKIDRIVFLDKSYKLRILFNLTYFYSCTSVFTVCLTLVIVQEKGS
jgi:hypothetical protein